MFYSWKKPAELLRKQLSQSSSLRLEEHLNECLSYGL